MSRRRMPRIVEVSASVGVDDTRRYWDLLPPTELGPGGDEVHPVHACSVVGLKVGEVLRPYFGGAPVIHLGQYLRVHNGITPGEPLAATARVNIATAKAAGFLVEVSTTITSAARGRVLDGAALALASVVEGGSFSDGSATGGRRWSQPPPPAEVAWTDHLHYTVTESQIGGFADCTGDDQAIHLSPAFARAVGLPGVVAHGMHTVAVCYGAAADRASSDGGRVASFVLRFARPIRPHAPVSVQVANVKEAIAVRAVSRGRSVTRGGFAVLAGTPQAPEVVG